MKNIKQAVADLPFWKAYHRIHKEPECYKAESAMSWVSERIHHGLKNTIHQRIRDRARISEGVPL